MDARLLDFINNSIYAALAAVAIFGLFMVILLFRRMSQKRFRTVAKSREFLDDVHADLDRRDFDQIRERCDSPAYWSKAVPQLIQLVVENRTLGPAKLRRIVAERFERDFCFAPKI